MSCFFGCFRVKDSNSNVVAPPKHVVAPRSKNALSSLFSCDDDSLGKAEEGCNQLRTKEEGKILKTPTEVVSEKRVTNHEEENPSNLSSSLPEASFEKLKMEKQSDEESPKPVKICEEVLTRSGSLSDSPSSYITDAHNTGGQSSSSISRCEVKNIMTPMKAHDSEVHTEVSNLQSSDMSAVSSEHSKESVSVGITTSLTKPSSNPTQQKLSDDRESTESSLSSWLKPPSAKQYGNRRYFGPISANKVVEDRPILGMVAAHWNHDVTPDHIKPKWWDGNGIPNSTSKYKEDQKVSWHATPFEERLEKALSEDTSISQSKPINETPPVEFPNESEESDTASSHYQSSPHLKSVVSL